MVDYKAILRLSQQYYSLRQIAASVCHSHHTVKSVLDLAAQHGIEWPLDDDITNAELEKCCIYYQPRQNRWVVCMLKPEPHRNATGFRLLKGMSDTEDNRCCHIAQVRYQDRKALHFRRH